MSLLASFRKSLHLLTCAGVALIASSCAVPSSAVRDTKHVVQISVPMQKLAVYRQGVLVKTYPISTSKFGIGDEKGSYKTPPGKLEIAEKIGSGKPSGAVFKSRKWTGEVIKPNSPGRDPIVSRILWLKGLEPENKNAYARCIYIHGTAAENSIGKPSSYGCVRMKSKDVINLYDEVGEGSQVMILRKGSLRDAKKVNGSPAKAIAPVTEITPVEPSVVAIPLATPVSAEAKSLGNEAEAPIFRTGADILKEAGFDTDYLTSEPRQLEAASRKE